MAQVAIQISTMGSDSKHSKRKSEPAHATQGFGVPLTIAPHHFVVVIPRGSQQAVQIIEDLGMHTQGGESDLLDRAILSRDVWTEIANPVKRTFNERLKAHNLKPGQWKVGENRVDRLLGKELCVLAWAVEDLAPEKIGTALRNWLSLRPEELWWLFGMTATTVGGPNDRGRGWRMALRYALGDTPQPTIREPRRGSKNKDKDIFETLPLFQSKDP
jgi:Protein of unknown function (DUF3780)